MTKIIIKIADIRMKKDGKSSFVINRKVNCKGKNSGKNIIFCKSKENDNCCNENAEKNTC